MDDILRKSERMTATDPRVALRLLAEAEVQADTIAALRGEVQQLRAYASSLHQALAYEQAQRRRLESYLVHIQEKEGFAALVNEPAPRAARQRRQHRIL